MPLDTARYVLILLLMISVNEFNNFFFSYGFKNELSISSCKLKKMTEQIWDSQLQSSISTCIRIHWCILDTLGESTVVANIVIHLNMRKCITQYILLSKWQLWQNHTDLIEKQTSYRNTRLCIMLCYIWELHEVIETEFEKINLSKYKNNMYSTTKNDMNELLNMVDLPETGSLNIFKEKRIT